MLELLARVAWFLARASLPEEQDVYLVEESSRLSKMVECYSGSSDACLAISTFWEEH